MGQIPCPLPSAAPPSSPMTPVATALQTPLSPGAIPSALPAQDCVFVGSSPRVKGESAMTVGLVDAEIPERKAVPVLLKCQNRLLTASPMARQGRLGWAIVPPSKEIRRVYNVFK